MKIYSQVFTTSSEIPAKYTCQGNDINPPLTFEDIPENTKSLALIVDDPDAPSGIWVHWVLYNISPSINKIAENSVPNGAKEGKTDFGSASYGGPCPPSGTHRYFFKLYALDNVLEFDQSPTKEQLLKAMDGHVIDKSELIGLYSKQ